MRAVGPLGGGRGPRWLPDDVPLFPGAGVVPDAETRFLLLAIFGPRSRPVRKCQRMLYWLPRMRHANPYPLPAQLPPPGLAAACLGLRRIANDPDARLSVYQVGDTRGGQRGQRGMGDVGGTWGDEGEYCGKRRWGCRGGREENGGKKKGIQEGYGVTGGDVGEKGMGVMEERRVGRQSGNKFCP